jgi:hypothetical protein
MNTDKHRWNDLLNLPDLCSSVFICGSILFPRGYDSTVNIALVGFTNSYNDQRWLEMAGAWVAEHDPAMAWASASRMVFDLRGENSSNFLDDPGEYDAVVLFAIYNPPMDSVEFQRALGRRSGQTSLAENHSRENWAERLSRTRAKYLLIFRRDDSVDGEWLGEIEQYEKQPEQAGIFGVSIYRLKINADHPPI